MLFFGPPSSEKVLNVLSLSFSDPFYQLDYHQEADANDLSSEDASIFISVASYR